MLYELVLWNAGNRSTLGFFKTKKEAADAMQLVKKYYAIGYESLQDRLADGDAGYEIIQHKYGFTITTESWIRYNQDMAAQRK